MPRLAGRARPSSRQFRPVAGADVIKGQFWLWGRQIARDGGHSIDVEIFGAGGAVHVRVPRRVVFTCPVRADTRKSYAQKTKPRYSAGPVLFFLFLSTLSFAESLVLSHFFCFGGLLVRSCCVRIETPDSTSKQAPYTPAAVRKARILFISLKLSNFSGKYYYTAAQHRLA